MTNSNTVQTDIFSVFGLVDEVAVKKEAERKAKEEELQKKMEAAKEAKAKQTSEKKASPAVTVEKFDPNEDTIIRYFGESIEIGKYFSAEELAEGILVKKADEEEPVRKPLEAAILRSRMEKDYPELVKEHTEMVYIKKKNIVIPTLKAKKKGNLTEAERYGGPLDFPFPKVPFAILRQFISLAKHFGKQNLEIHADVYFNPYGQTYFLDVPAQEIHRYYTEVTESATEIASRVGDAIKVLEIHSHHHMLAIPSSQDNESERIPFMFYGIVGLVDDYFPQLYFRRFINDDVEYLNIPIETIFSSPYNDLPNFDINRIEVTL